MTPDSKDRARQPLPTGTIPVPGVRLPFATRISEDIDRRLRLTALARRMPLSQLLDQLLDQALAPVGELAEQIQRGGPQ